MALIRVLSDVTSEVSEEFGISFQVSITLENTIIGGWTVERNEGSLGDGGTRTWVTVHDEFLQSESGGIVDGTNGYVYRVNLGSGNAGPIVNVTNAYIGSYRK